MASSDNEFIKVKIKLCWAMFSLVSLKVLICVYYMVEGMHSVTIPGCFNSNDVYLQNQCRGKTVDKLSEGHHIIQVSTVDRL